MANEIEVTAPLGFLILHELRRPGSGTDIVKRLEKRRKSRLTPGTIYPALKQLHKKRLISYRSEGRSKVYRLTNKGTKELRLLYDEFSTLFSGMKGKIK